MTDKQIIIYGVDIRLLRTPVEVMDYLQQDGLYVVTKELFEQLKAKEQECENNKIAHQMELDIYNQECLNLQEELKAKEQECERLKYDNDYEVGALERTIDNLKAENKHLNDLLNQALKELEKTRETLTEIKEIAESEIDSKEFMAIQCMLNGSVDNKNKVLKQILQKISECEGNDETN